jgi:hypothetical protein
MGLVSQPDVLALKSVILTTGRPGNLNDDVMLNEEILPVLHTAALKPFNVEHSKLIIGCIFDAFAIDRETGKVVKAVESYDEDMDDDEREAEAQAVLSNIKNIPENLDIITNQVLWSLHFPEIVSEIKKKAIIGEMFVSMELWFTDYDYLVGNRIVKRNPETSMVLDAKLRINGGSGFLGLDRVRRVPRKVTFAGNAAVETPANPDSFILDVMDRTDLMDSKKMEIEEDKSESVNASIVDMLNANTISVLPSLRDGSQAEDGNVDDIGRSDTSLGNEAIRSAKAEVDEVVNSSEEIEMESSEKKVVELLEKNAVLTKAAEDVTSELAEASKANEELQTQNAELEAKIEEHVATIQKREEELAAKTEAAEKLEADKAELASALETANAKLAEIEEARKLEARTAELTELGLSEERIARVIAKTAELDEEAFAAEVEDLKAFISEFKIEKPEEVETAEVEEEVAEEPAAEVEEAAASEEDVAEILDELEEEEAPEAKAIASLPETDEVEETGKALEGIFAKAMGVRLDANK